MSLVQEELREVLNQEARLLDKGFWNDWLELLTPDIQYQVPVRQTLDGSPEFSEDLALFWDDRETLAARIRRLGTDFAWAENPRSRVRHFISNISFVSPLDGDEVTLEYYLMVYRNRGSEPEGDLISGERRDTWRRTSQGWRLAQRTVYLDQVVLGTKNLSFLL